MSSSGGGKKATAASGATNRPSVLKLTIPAGGAAPTPPVGPALGQKGVKAMDFCRQFNDQSKVYQAGVPLRCEITVNPDRTFAFVVRPPATAWLLKRAAGIEKASSSATVVKIDNKYIYEVARIKSTDPKLAHMPLRLLFRMVLAQARAIGFKVF